MGIFNWLFKRKNKQLELSTKQYNGKIGLALSGGGAKGFAHIGVLRAFEQAGITFDYIAGTSAGSIIASLYAAGFDSHSIESLGKAIKESDIKSSKMIFTPSKSANLVTLMRRFLGDMEFSDLKIPFCCVATDLLTGEEIVLDSGNIATAVAASCSAPVFFDGVMREDRRLVDGGLTNNLPADVVRRMGADIVVSVNLGNTGNPGTDSKNMLSVLMAVISITMKSTALKGVLNSDFVITPDMVGHRATKLKGENLMIEAGYKATIEVLPQIKEALGIKPPKPPKQKKPPKAAKTPKQKKASKDNKTPVNASYLPVLVTNNDNNQQKTLVKDESNTPTDPKTNQQ